MNKTMEINGKTVLVIDVRTPPNAEEIKRKYLNAKEHAYSLLNAMALDKGMGKLNGANKDWAFFKGGELAMEHIKFVNGETYEPCFWEFKVVWDAFTKCLVDGVLAA